MVFEEPFERGVCAAWFEDAEDFCVDAFEGGGMASCFNGVDAVKSIVGERHFHEIAFDEGDFVALTLSVCIDGGTGNSDIRRLKRVLLVVIIVETDNVAAGEGSDFSSWATDTTTHVQDHLISLDSQLHRQVVFMSRKPLKLEHTTESIPDEILHLYSSDRNGNTGSIRIRTNRWRGCSTN